MFIGEFIGLKIQVSPFQAETVKECHGFEILFGCNTNPRVHKQEDYRDGHATKNTTGIKTTVTNKKKFKDKNGAF